MIEQNYIYVLCFIWLNKVILNIYTLKIFFIIGFILIYALKVFYIIG